MVGHDNEISGIYVLVSGGYDNIVLGVVVSVSGGV